MAGNTDGCHFAVLEFLGIGGLIGLFAITPQVVNIAILIVVIISKSGIQASFEGLKIHGIGIKHILVLYLGVVPRLGDMDLIGVCLGILATFALAQDISGRVIVNAIGETVIRVVELLNTASTPSCMILRVLQGCLSL